MQASATKTSGNNFQFHVTGDRLAQKEWQGTRRSLQQQFNITLPGTWVIDRETWDKFRRLSPDSVSDTELQIALIQNGYVGLTPKEITAIWGDDLQPPTRGATWDRIRVIFYRDPFGAWHDYGTGSTPYARLRLPQENAKTAKYLSPKGSGAKLFTPYKLGKFCGVEPCQVWGYTSDGDDSQWARRGQWLLTEGEDKSIVASLYGYPTIAIAGVDMWRSQGGVINPWLFDFCCRAELLTIAYDADIFYKDRVFAALGRLVSEIEGHLRSLGECGGNSKATGADYYEQVWPDAEVDFQVVEGRSVQYVSVHYAYLPPNPYAKGLDDVLAIAEGNWLDTLLAEAPSAFAITVEEGEKGNTAKCRRLLTAPKHLGLVSGKLSPLESNAIALARGAITAGWLQLNQWRYVGEKSVHCWDEDTSTWFEAKNVSLAHFAIQQWSSLAPTSKNLDGVPHAVSAEMYKFGSIEANLGLSGHRYIGVANGDYNVATSRLEPIAPEHHVFHRIKSQPVEGKPEKFMAFYADRMTGGMADVERFISLLAVGLRSPGLVHAIGWIMGPPDAGKSTLLKLLRLHLFDELIYQGATHSALLPQNANKGFLPMGLYGCPIFFDDDYKGGMNHEMVSLINTLATNTPMLFRAMGGDAVSLAPNLLPIFCSNQTPQISCNDAEGFARRIQLFEFQDMRMGRDDYGRAETLLINEASQFLWYLLNKPLEACVAELEAFSHRNRDSIEDALNSNHVGDWLGDFAEWAKQHISSIPEGNHLGESSAALAKIHVGGTQTTPAGHFSEDVPEKQQDNLNPWQNFLPEYFAIKRTDNGAEFYASASRWVEAIANYERRVHNPSTNATKKAPSTVFGLLRSGQGRHDVIEGVTKDGSLKVGGRGGKFVRGWMISVRL